MLKILKSQFGFSFNALKFRNNPYKRNYNTQFLDIRDDRHAWGRIILPKAVARKEENHQYKIEAAELVFNTLSKQNKNLQLDFKKYEEIKENSWYVHGIKIDQIVDQILDILSEGHILKEHHYRHGVEKL